MRHAPRLAAPAVAALALGFAASAHAEEPPRPDPVAAQAGALRQKTDALLRRELTERWYPKAVDRTGGNNGFHQTFARDWSPLPDDNRFSVYQARMTWTAAAFARYAPERADEYRGYVAHGVEFLDTRLRDAEHGGFHWIVGPDGNDDPKLGGEKHVYGTAFVLYAASEAYAVTRDPRALKVARDAFDWLENQAHDREHGGYFEAVTREGTPVVARDDAAPVSKRTDRLGVYYGFKSMNAHIHLLEALAAFSGVSKAPLARERLAETHAIVRDKIAAEPGALNLYLTRDWKPAPAHDSFGHDVETAFLLAESAHALGTPDDPATWRVARKLIDHALDWGWDDEHGGFYDKGDVFAGRPYDTTKVWWTQAEGLNALLLMHRKFGKETDRYGRAFLKQWDFIERHQIDPDHGGWFGEVTREGKLLGDGRKATQWKANYHTGRALMNVATTLGEIEKGQNP